MGLVISGGQSIRVRSSVELSMREAITDVSRQVEDLAWTSLSTDTRGLALDDMYDDRRRMIQRIRTYRRRNPLAKRVVALLQHYVLGGGVALKANNRPIIQKVVDEFWDDPVNQKVFTGYLGMIEAVDTIATDGQLFLTLFPDPVLGRVQLSVIDFVYVDDIIMDPENAKVPLWYKVRRFRQDFDFTQGTYIPHTGTDFVYYRDWKNPEGSADNPDAKGQTDLQGQVFASIVDGAKPKPFAPPKADIADGLIYHIAINRRGKFGESEFAASVDWLKAHKEFMEDRASITRAAAQFAWRKKRRGPASDIAAATMALQSSMTKNINQWEYNPPNAPAATIVENEGSAMDWIKTDTGGANALADERVMRMMVGAGTGVMNHYFGDEANANLATATAMELPMLKMYQSWQTLLGNAIKDIVGFVLQTANAAGVIADRDDQSQYAPAQTASQGAIQMQEAGPPMGGGDGAAPANLDAIVAALAKTAPSKNPDADREYATTGKLDWYVDVGFPPIIEKDVGQLVTALKGLYEILPNNVDSQKLVVKMLLIALGENDVDEIMDALFAIDAEPRPGGIGPDGMPIGIHPGIAALAGLLGPGGDAPADPQDQKLLTPGPQEAWSEPLPMAQLRVRRLLRSARAASDALARVGS